MKSRGQPSTPGYGSGWLSGFQHFPSLEHFLLEVIHVIRLFGSNYQILEQELQGLKAATPKDHLIAVSAFGGAYQQVCRMPTALMELAFSVMDSAL